MVRKKKKGSIPIPKPPETKEEIVTVQENEFTIDLYYKKWMGSTAELYKKEKFTNCVKDMAEFERNIMIIMMEYFPKICKDFEEIFVPGKRTGHCHRVDQNKLDIIIEAIKQIHKSEVDNIQFDKVNENGYDWWYLGFKQNIRLIGLYNKTNNKFLPMLIDHHHLIHGNEYYNQTDYKNYCYCPVNKYEESKL